MGEYTDRARGRLTTNRADHEAAVRQYTQEAAGHLATLSHRTARLAEMLGQRNNVLETGIGLIDANGALERTYRAPFASVLVANASTGFITVTPAGRGTAPGPGAGSFQVPPSSVVGLPLIGGAVTFYGTAGALFSYAVLAAPVPPIAASLNGTSGTAQKPVSVPSSISNTTISLANPNRRGLILQNASTAVAQVNLSGGDATAGWSFTLQPGERYEMSPVLGNLITAAWVSANGSMLVTEVD